MRDFIEDQRQELITRLFLQAIPPASPSTSESRAGDQEDRGRSKGADDKPIHYTKAELDLKVIEERTMVSFDQSLCFQSQRMRSLF